jgi:CubicO group peptidase (beta-lactamase class C family)
MRTSVISTGNVAATSRAARSSRRQALSALAASVAIATAAGACGTSPRPTPARARSAGGSAVSRPQAYAACMRDHRVSDFPNPVNGRITLTPASGIDPSSPTFQAASQACASDRPSGGTRPTGRSGIRTAGSQPTTSTWAGFSAWLEQRAAANEFSGTVLVAHHGRPVLDAAYGLADRSDNIDNTPQTKFCIASIGKLFTAIAIAQLAQHHKLDFNHTIGLYLPGFSPAVADHVTIAELLTMTSGLDDVVLSRPNPPKSLAGMIKLIAHEPLELNPGSRFSYGNDGYIVLGAIIEKLTDESYDSYLRQHIFKRAGMTDTDVRVYTPAHVDGMAHGYMLVGHDSQPLSPGAHPALGSGSQPTTLDDNSATLQIANPSGGGYSTARDLMRFAEALLHDRLLTPAMTKIILTPRVNSPQPGGPPVDKYTYGFAYQTLNGVSFIGHNGGTPGYEAQIDIYPRSRYIVIILTNQDQTMVPAIRKSEQILTNA